MNNSGLITSLLVGLTLGSACTVVLAQPKPLRPGLWEMQVKNAELDAARAEMKKRFALMPPQARAQMEQMMASRGIALDRGSLKACITPEQASRGPVMPEEGCKQDYQWSGSVGKFTMSCADGRKGNGEITFVSDRQWHGWGNFSDPKQGNKLMKFENSGRWISDDCGKIRPIADR